MVARSTRDLGMISAGAAIVVALCVAGAMLAATMNSTAVQASVSGTLEVAPGEYPLQIAAIYSNLGNRPAPIPPLSVPLLLVGGFPFGVGPTSPAGTVEESANGFTVFPAIPSDGSACSARLELSSLFQGEYEIVEGANYTGPATLSAVFAGTSAWPSTGYGLMTETNLSSLFVVQTGGNGTTMAVVNYYSYNQSAGEIVGLVAHSSPFEFDTNEPALLSLSLGGAGSFVASVNGIPRLNGWIENFLPGPSPVAAWANNTSAVLGVVASIGGDTLWLGPTSTCGSQLILPLASTARPQIVSKSSSALLVGPIAQSEFTAASIYVLEVALSAIPSQPSVTVAGGTPVSLNVNESLEFTVPWGS